MRWCMSYNIHESLQYQLRKDLRIGKDSESINSLFIEIDKLTIGTKYNVIIACIYRPPHGSIFAISMIY